MKSRNLEIWIWFTQHPVPKNTKERALDLKHFHPVVQGTRSFLHMEVFQSENCLSMFLSACLKNSGVLPLADRRWSCTKLRHFLRKKISQLQNLYFSEIELASVGSSWFMQYHWDFFCLRGSIIQKIVCWCVGTKNHKLNRWFHGWRPFLSGVSSS